MGGVEAKDPAAFSKPDTGCHNYRQADSRHGHFVP